MSLIRFIEILKDFWLEVVKGNREGLTVISKFGENPDIDSGGTFEHVCDNGGTYIPPTPVGGRIHDISSSDANDSGTVKSNGNASGGSVYTLEDSGATFVSDGVSIGDAILIDNKIIFAQITSVTETILTFAGGTREPSFGLLNGTIESNDTYRIVSVSASGSTILYIDGIDGATFLKKEEFIVMNGITNVPTITSFRRINRMKTFGSIGAGNAGTVNATAQTDATITSQIRIGLNQTFQAIYSVPIDKTAYIKKYWAALTSRLAASSTIRFRGGTLGGTPYPIQTTGLTATGGPSFQYKWEYGGLPASGGADIWIEANSDTNNVSIAAGFELVLEDI